MKYVRQSQNNRVTIPTDLLMVLMDLADDKFEKEIKELEDEGKAAALPLSNQKVRKVGHGNRSPFRDYQRPAGAGLGGASEPAGDTVEEAGSRPNNQQQS